MLPPQNLWVEKTPVGQLFPEFSARFSVIGGIRLSFLESRLKNDVVLGVSTDLSLPPSPSLRPQFTGVERR
jgi:hypothetical protein